MYGVRMIELIQEEVERLEQSNDGTNEYLNGKIDALLFVIRLIIKHEQNEVG